MDEWKKPVRQLAQAVVSQGESTAHAMGEIRVLVLAVAALVRTHPDPEAFATEMRRAWLQAETEFGETSTDAHLQSGIESVLQVIEGNCSAPLNIRPPGQALPPEH